MSIQSVRPLHVGYQVQLKDEGPSPDQDIRSNTFLCGAVGEQEIVTNLRALTLWMCSAQRWTVRVFTQEKDLVLSLASFNLSPSHKHSFPKQIFPFDSCFYSLSKMCFVTLCCFIILALPRVLLARCDPSLWELCRVVRMSE